ncbi:hypothetical protein DCC81_12140 [Chitinophaga parva]|uniref:Uncharacterized protein n=1 Tax=Chitinophaga parva TaxID=2169414 RepID=A0A2T7BFJ3_9BACT|nr:hypothetical protein [Chitinophaga parva]PUZ25056.1 hypothetical protein DCC81_12140 [Chitinophaga parva]
MSNANVVKNNNTAINMKPLAEEECNKLAAVVLGYGKLLQASETMALPKNTIKRAIAGMNLTPTTAAKIRSFLKTIPDEQ